MSHEMSSTLEEVINWIILGKECSISMHPVFIYYGAIVEN
jgi:hypothetical protein